MISPSSLALLGRNWGWLMCKGIAGLVFGIWALVASPPSLIGLAAVTGIYLIVDGICCWGAAVHGARSGRLLPNLTGAGVVTVFAGIITLCLSSQAAGVIWTLVVWAGLMGLLQSAAAQRIGVSDSHMGRLAFAGLLAFALAISLALVSHMGLVSWAICLGIYGILFGLTMMGLADSLYWVVENSAGPGHRFGVQPELWDDESSGLSVRRTSNSSHG